MCLSQNKPSETSVSPYVELGLKQGFHPTPQHHRMVNRRPKGGQKPVRCPFELGVCHFDFGGMTSSASLSVLICRMMTRIKRHFRGLFRNEGLMMYTPLPPPGSLLTFEGELSEQGSAAYQGRMGCMGLESDSQAHGHHQTSYMIAKPMVIIKLPLDTRYCSQSALGKTRWHGGLPPGGGGLL